MDYEIVNLDEKIVIGVGRETTNANMQAVKDIGEVWEQFFANNIFERIQEKINGKTIGLYTDYQGDFTKPYNFVACCEVKEVKEMKSDLVKKVIPSGKYAKFIITGDVKEAAGNFWAQLWGMDLNRAYTCDFEEYQNNSEDMSNQEIYIYISLN